MSELSDADLVRRIRAGETPRFRELVERYQAAVFAVAVSRLGRREDGLDVAQEALLQAYAGLDRLEDPARFGAWLCGIARRLAALHQRKAVVDRTARQKRSSEPPQAGGDWPDPLETMNRTELRLAIRRAVLKLPDDQREVVALFYLSSWAQPRIAAFIDRPVGTVKRLLHEARQRLHKELLAVGIDDAQSCTPGPEFTNRVLNAVTQVRVRPDGDSSRVFLTDERGRSMMMIVTRGTGDAMSPYAKGGGPSSEAEDAYHAMLRALAQTGWGLRELEITEVKLHAFHGCLRMADGSREQAIDCRPSDGLNLALRAKAPVFIADALADHHQLRGEDGQPLPPQRLDEPDALSQFRPMQDPRFADLWQVVDALKRDPEDVRARHALLCCAADFFIRPAVVVDTSAGMAPLLEWVQDARDAGERALALSLLGAVRLWAMKDAEAAIEPLEEAIRLAPDDGHIRFDLATAYARAGRADDALDLFDRPFQVMGQDARHVALNTGNLSDIWDQPRFEEVLGEPHPDARVMEIEAVMRTPAYRNPPQEIDAAARQRSFAKARERLGLTSPSVPPADVLRPRLAAPPPGDLPDAARGLELSRAVELRRETDEHDQCTGMTIRLEAGDELKLAVKALDAEILAGTFVAGRPARPQTAALFATVLNRLDWSVRAALVRRGESGPDDASLLLKGGDRVEQVAFPIAAAVAVAFHAEAPVLVER